MRVRWWPVRTVREKLQRRIDEVDDWLRQMVAGVPASRRDAAFQAQVDELLRKRSALMAQRDLGFMVTDRRKVRG